MSVVLDFVGDPTAFLAGARTHIHALREGGSLSGNRLTTLLSAAVDNTIRGLFQRTVADGVLSAERARDGVCLVAVGGYARKVLCPHSDIDLLLVSDGAGPGGELEDLAQRVLYPLWDSKLQVGHFVGSVDEILAQGDGDPARQTSLLDCRFLAGSHTLFDTLRGGVAHRTQTRWRDELLARVRPENQSRWRRYGDSVFLLEPNVKEGKGGLRDLHWLLWIGRVVFGLRGDMDFLLAGIMEPAHYQAITEAWEFLLRVRVALHERVGRAHDRLHFEHQEPIAKALGFRRAGGLLAVERFMGEYYRHAWAMAHFTGLYVRRLTGFYWDEETGEGPLTLGPSAPVVRADRSEKRASDDLLFVLEDGAVRCRDADILRAEPHRIIDLFLFLQHVGGRLHHDTMEDVRSALPKIGARYRKDPSIAARFRLLLEKSDLFRVLVAMHRSGFLGRYIPEFGKVFCQAQYNRVHLYTVDVHSLYAVRELCSLSDPAVAQTAPLFARAWEAASPRGPLVLAALFHDIAKSHGSAHSRVGAEWMPKILGRMGWDSDSIARTAWLVRHHLVLPDTAYHRDVYDPATQAELAAIVPSRAWLDDLLALTFADTRATNPELWTNWKQSLIEEAYGATLRALSVEVTGAVLPTVDAVRARVEALLLPEVGRKRAPELVAQLTDVAVKGQPKYIERTTPEQLATHAILLDQLAHAVEHAKVAPFLSHVRHLPDRGVSEWTVASVDQRGLFSLLAGVLGACGLSIVSAAAVTRMDGTVIDTFWVVNQQGKLADSARTWTRVDRTLAATARGEKDLDDLLAAARRSAPPPKEAGATGLARVLVSNDLSEVATVVEVVTQDRIGLLHDITAVLRDFDLDLTVARIATRQDMASDTFYVLSQRGQKLGVRRGKRLRAALRREILTPAERSSGG